MGVGVDEAGRDHVALGVDLFPGRAGQLADVGDAPVDDADIGLITGQAGAVDDGSVADQEIKGHGCLLGIGSTAKAPAPE